MRRPLLALVLLIACLSSPAARAAEPPAVEAERESELVIEIKQLPVDSSSHSCRTTVAFDDRGLYLECSCGPRTRDAFALRRSMFDDGGIRELTGGPRLIYGLP